MKNSIAENRFDDNLNYCKLNICHTMRKVLVAATWAIVLMLFTARLTAQYVDPVNKIDIPAMCFSDEVSIDGVDGEHYWSQKMAMMIAKRAGTANLYGLEYGDSIDFNAFFKVAWGLDYLYLFVEVTDDIEESMPVGGEQWWTWDNFEIFIDLDTCSYTNYYDSTKTVHLHINRGDAGITGSGRATADEFLYTQVNNDDGWIVEIGVPWKAASAPGTMPDMLKETEGLIGFDISVSDADGPGGGTIGGRNEEGGAQMFWDQDTPIDNADNAYQNRRVFGWAAVTGGFCPPPWININEITPDLHFLIYPNPASDYLIIYAVNSSDLHGCTVNITNLLGETLLVKEIDQHPCKIDLSTISSRGLHFIRLYDKAHNLLQVNKIILQ